MCRKSPSLILPFTKKSWVQHLNTILAWWGGNLNKPIFKSSNARGLCGEMMKLFHWSSSSSSWAFTCVLDQYSVNVIFCNFPGQPCSGSTSAVTMLGSTITITLTVHLMPGLIITTERYHQTECVLMNGKFEVRLSLAFGSMSASQQLPICPSPSPATVSW